MNMAMSPARVTILAAAFEVAHLAWEYAHGGVRAHHVLNRPDLPAVSNWWGIIIVPALAWVAARSATRLGPSRVGVATAAIGAFLLGLALSVAFIAGVQSLAFALFLAVLLSGLVVPTYRPEYPFGFVIGMTFTFGAVLPTMVALIAAAVSLFAHRAIRPAIAWSLGRSRQ